MASENSILDAFSTSMVKTKIDSYLSTLDSNLAKEIQIHSVDRFLLAMALSLKRDEFLDVLISQNFKKLRARSNLLKKSSFIRRVF
jgi:hypothetical protein